MVGIINYIGNIGSVKNALDYLKIPNFIADKPEQLCDATHIIIPGVGNWTEGVKRLKPFYKYLKSTRKPILGICLGHQLLARESKEGEGRGLGLLNCKVRKLKNQRVGWYPVKDKTYYFVHGYSIFFNGHQIDEFEIDNLTGCQYHLEKSQSDGLERLKNWYEKNNPSAIIA